MVALIADQVHQFLKNQEEERCRAVEAEYNKHKETIGKKVKRREIPKPVVRPSDSGLCQESTFLLMVSEYDYDLSNKTFQAYCSARGVLHVAGELGSRRWKYLADYRKTKSAYFADSYFQLSEEVDGKQHRYTNEEMETSWKIMLLGRAKLQDCWELYSRKSHMAKGD
jgi:hypothetical protein